MHNRILIAMLCVSGLSACASKPPIAYCPYPPIPGPSVTDAILDSAGSEGIFYLNRQRKYFCKYWNVYDKEEFKDNCDQITNN